MHGEIGVESAEGRGSTFWFTLPLPVDSGSQPEMPQADSLRGIRVLIVDDNEVNRRIVLERVAGWGMLGDDCSSGREALAALEKAASEGRPYDMAIIDFQMPEMDGELLGRKIKEDPALKRTALVMLTSVGRQGDARRLTESGFAGYLLKPVRYTQLYGVLVTVWGAIQNCERTGELITRHTVAEAGYWDTKPISASREEGQAAARVLVAEDNVVNQRLAKAIIERLGWRVDLACNGREAVDMLGSRSYDVVFMDCQMPELDGYEAAREIRKQYPGRERVPIIAMTAHAMPGDREKCFNAGMDDYVAKPIRPRVIKEILDRWRPHT
jgi:CheY-like chemotaxis protein